MILLLLMMCVSAVNAAQDPDMVAMEELRAMQAVLHMAQSEFDNLEKVEGVSNVFDPDGYCVCVPQDVLKMTYFKILMHHASSIYQVQSANRILYDARSMLLDLVKEGKFQGSLAETALAEELVVGQVVSFGKLARFIQIGRNLLSAQARAKYLENYDVPPAVDATGRAIKLTHAETEMQYAYVALPTARNVLLFRVWMSASGYKKLAAHHGTDHATHAMDVMKRFEGDHFVRGREAVVMRIGHLRSKIIDCLIDILRKGRSHERGALYSSDMLALVPDCQTALPDFCETMKGMNDGGLLGILKLCGAVSMISETVEQADWYMLLSCEQFALKLKNQYLTVAGRPTPLGEKLKASSKDAQKLVEKSEADKSDKGKRRAAALAVWQFWRAFLPAQVKRFGNMDFDRDFSADVWGNSRSKGAVFGAATPVGRLWETLKVFCSVRDLCVRFCGRAPDSFSRFFQELYAFFHWRNHNNWESAEWARANVPLDHEYLSRMRTRAGEFLQGSKVGDIKYKLPVGPYNNVDGFTIETYPGLTHHQSLMRVLADRMDDLHYIPTVMRNYIVRSLDWVRSQLGHASSSQEIELVRRGVSHAILGYHLNTLFSQYADDILSKIVACMDNEREVWAKTVTSLNDPVLNVQWRLFLSTEKGGALRRVRALDVFLKLVELKKPLNYVNKGVDSYMPKILRAVSSMHRSHEREQDIALMLSGLVRHTLQDQDTLARGYITNIAMAIYYTQILKQTILLGGGDNSIYNQYGRE